MATAPRMPPLEGEVAERRKVGGVRYCAASGS